MKIISGRKKSAITLFLLGLCASLCFMAVIFAVNASADFTLKLSDEICENYETGTVFEVPRASFTDGTQSYRAQSVVYDPDREVITDRSFILDKKGEYRVSYSAVIDGKNYYRNYSFRSAQLTENVFTNLKNVSVASKSGAPDYFESDVTGVKLTATSDGGNADYSQTIDLKYNTKEDLLLSLAVIPEEKNTEDLYQITITLSDVYDMTNTVRIVTYRGSWSNQYCFTRAAATRQTLAGLNGEKVETEYRMGAGVSHSFAGNNLRGCDRINYYFDYEEKALYVSPSSDKISGGLVMDFDDPNYIADTLLWDGFTTGEVKMNISLEKLQKTPASVLVLNVNGNDLGGEVFPDREGPVFSFDFGAYEKENLPKGVVGKNYPLFSVSAYDRVDGKISPSEMKVGIYYQDKDSETLVSEESENFLPEQAGVYKVRYSATDKSGNLGSAEYFIEVSENLPAMELKEDYQVSEAAYVGETVLFPDFEVEGGSGNVSVGWIIKDESGDFEDTDPVKFFPEREGVYTLKVTATDYIGQKFEKEYRITVTVKQAPVITVGYVPKYLVSGIAYTFEDFEAIDYFTQPDPVSAEKSIEIEYDGEKTILTDDYTFIPVIKGGATQMTVRFCASSADGKYSDFKKYNVNLTQGITEDQKVHFTEYFVTEKAVLTEQPEDMTVNFAEDASVKYVNPFVANGVRAVFNVDSEKNNFSRINIFLTDVVDESIKIKLSIFRNNPETTACALSINDGAPVYKIVGSFFGNTRNYFDLSFSMDTLYLMDRSANSVITNIGKALSGRDFSGFPSRKCYLSFSFEEVSDDSSVKIYSLGNNAFNDVGVDYAPPMLDLTCSIVSDVHFGSQIRIPRAVVTDAVDPCVPVTVTVTCGERTLYNEADISKEDLFVTADSYLPYKITYQAEDMFGRSVSRTYTVYPLDEEAPVLEVNWDLSKAKKGSTHTLPKATVTDNNETDLAASIFVQYPNGEYRLYTESKIKFSMSGNYLIRYFVWDESGNFAYKDFTVVVS